MRKKKRSKRKLIWIILAILSIAVVAIIVSFSEVDNKNVAEMTTEKTKSSISRQESTKDVKSDMEATDEKGSDNNTSGNSSLNNNKQGDDKKETANKDTNKETSSNSVPTHKHEWEAVTKTKKNKSQIPVYGDVCRTCHEDVTGIGDIHILEGNCTGYDTDVIVLYKEITETVSYTVYECSCGATKK